MQDTREPYLKLHTYVGEEIRMATGIGSPARKKAKKKAAKKKARRRK